MTNEFPAWRQKSHSLPFCLSLSALHIIQSLIPKFLSPKKSGSCYCFPKQTWEKQCLQAVCIFICSVHTHTHTHKEEKHLQVRKKSNYYWQNLTYFTGSGLFLNYSSKKESDELILSILSQEYKIISLIGVLTWYTALLSVLGNATYICTCVYMYIHVLKLKRIVKFPYPCKIMCI